jgi:hypothetical protein
MLGPELALKKIKIYLLSVLLDHLLSLNELGLLAIGLLHLVVSFLQDGFLILRGLIVRVRLALV